MVIDTSVLAAILLREDDRRELLEKMSVAPRLLLSAANLVEIGVVLMCHSTGDHEHRLDPLLERAGIQVVPVDYPQALLATEAYRRYGKGRHHASLNLGDCFSYALAVRTGYPLLFKGNDFSHTDVLRA
jgi:ribonuclease VapC